MVNDQFTRLRLLVGDEGMQKLQNAFVIVAGLGAVGSYAVEALARAGIGRLRLIDSDTVSLSNLNRQLFALHSTIGRPKTEIAALRVRDINPACQTELHQKFINADSIPELFSGKPDFVIDAIDSLNPKTDLIAYLYENKIPFISSMGAALRTDPRLSPLIKWPKSRIAVWPICCANACAAEELPWISPACILLNRVKEFQRRNTAKKTNRLPDWDATEPSWAVCRQSRVFSD